MENNELQTIWRELSGGLNYKSNDELNLLLISKTRQTMVKFLTISVISIITGLGLIIYLIITGINRSDDKLFLINNIALGITAGTALVSGIFSWKKLKMGHLSQPLKNWLEIRIEALSKSHSRKSLIIYFLILPIIYIQTLLSIHVYFEHIPFIEIFSSSESLWGLMFGFPIGLFVSIISVYKIRKYHANNLLFLKDLYNRLLTDL